MPSLSQTIAGLEKDRMQEQAAESRRRSIAGDPRYNRIQEQFPDEGPLRRKLYPKHLEFFAAGAAHKERCFMAGNRVGKTRAGACETTYHLTGIYPHWWVGKRFNTPIEAWAVGSTAQTTRDILQAELLGKPAPDTETGPRDAVGVGTGMIPGRYILSVRKGANGAVETAWIRHSSGGVSILGFKSYAQGRESFQGTAKHLVWVDEECPFDIYLECLTRTMTTRGIIYLTFTPLQGLTETVLHFMPAIRLDADSAPVPGGDSAGSRLAGEEVTTG